MKIVCFVDDGGTEIVRCVDDGQKKLVRLKSSCNIRNSRDAVKADESKSILREVRARTAKNNDQTSRSKRGGKPFEDGVVGNGTRGILVYI